MFQMRKIMMGATVAMAASMAPNAALAFNVTADCNGWSVSSAYPGTTVTVDLTLKTAAGETVASPSVNGSYVDAFTLSGSWTPALTTGNYVLSGVVTSDVRTDPICFSAGDCAFEFTCNQPPPPPPPGDGIPRTPGFWKNHLSDWPATTPTVAGVNDAACLLQVLNQPVRGNANVILLHHLIAAELNVAPNAGDVAGDVDSTEIASTIAAAEAYLAGQFTNCSVTAASDTARALSLKDTLAAFNESAQ
jgi:hypothetical protein